MLPAHLCALEVADARRVEHLRGMLALSVPAWQERIAKSWHPHKRHARAAICARELGQRGDALMFGSKRGGHAALAFHYLAESIALASFQPGGIRCFGLRFEAT